MRQCSLYPMPSLLQCCVCYSAAIFTVLCSLQGLVCQSAVSFTALCHLQRCVVSSAASFTPLEVKSGSLLHTFKLSQWATTFPGATMGPGNILPGPEQLLGECSLERYVPPGAPWVLGPRPPNILRLQQAKATSLRQAEFVNMQSIYSVTN